MTADLDQKGTSPGAAVAGLSPAGRQARFYTQAGEARAVALRERGWTLRQIADDLDCSISTVGELLGGLADRARQRLTGGALELFERTASVEQTAALMGCSPATAARRLAAAGATVPPRYLVSEATAKAVAEYQSGKSIRQVAELVGGSYRWVREALVDAGVLRRQRKRTEKSAKQRAEESLQAVFIAAYRGGLSIEAAASNVGHSYSWGRGVLVDAHVPRRGSGTRRRTDADRPGWL